MFPLAHGDLYRTPAEHQPPDDADLIADTEYPNLNSRDYVKRPLNHQMRMSDAWECVALNERDHVVLATNKMSGREWTGSLWGFEQLATPLTAEKACFKLQCKSSIAKLQYVSGDIIIVAFRSGNVQVWSTRSEVRNPSNPYCLFLIGEKLEHEKPIVCMDVTKANINKAITGSKDGTLKIWDMGSADLFSTHSFHAAHTDVITAVDSSFQSSCIFATCSFDRSALLWDDRLARPATAIYEHHNVRFKDVKWAVGQGDAVDTLVHLGDEAGSVHTVDTRLPNKIINSTNYFGRPIRKIAPNGKYLAIIGDTNVVCVSNVGSGTLHKRYETGNIVRDVAWSNSAELISVGYEGVLLRHDRFL